MNIELLLKYAEKNGLAAGLDIALARNRLLELFGCGPFEGEVTGDFNDLDAILEPLLDYAYENDLIEHNSTTYRDLFEGKIMGILTPGQTEIITKFQNLQQTQGIQAATDYFYQLSSATNYIKTKRIKKNLQWTHKTEFGELEITINLSKPELDPKEIAMAGETGDTNYPKCLLCVENVGFAGNIKHPARQNHRILPITLGEEQWYWQYSPYQYYNEHCIPLCGEHRPMEINISTFEKLLDFLDMLPHYFVGSNAGLPIVGGSMLSHIHFQGGRHTFPIEKTAAIKTYELMGVTAEIIKWPMSVIRIKSKDRNRLVTAAGVILKKWQGYEDVSVDIVPYSGQTPHNAITPIARFNSNGEYEFDLVLRNNRTSEEFPDGIFHPHPHVHHVKKENIGLIEVMGLAILPGRLAEQVINAPNRREVEASIGDTFLEVLTHAGVFKTSPKGLKAFERFIQTLYI
ncbi:MAG: UDP-glucose--hexose-1-phosphate uridylyltransferase [Firmicutes bacterium]|nr:UDP-glucose--hexose-1-phosphate uridylyltransferase [Bacillota bacterium]